MTQHELDIIRDRCIEAERKRDWRTLAVIAGLLIGQLEADRQGRHR